MEDFPTAGDGRYYRILIQGDHDVSVSAVGKIYLRTTNGWHLMSCQQATIQRHIPHTLLFLCSYFYIIYDCGHCSVRTYVYTYMYECVIIVTAVCTHTYLQYHRQHFTELSHIHYFSFVVFFTDIHYTCEFINVTLYLIHCLGFYCNSTF